MGDIIAATAEAAAQLIQIQQNTPATPSRKRGRNTALNSALKMSKEKKIKEKKTSATEFAQALFKVYLVDCADQVSGAAKGRLPVWALWGLYKRVVS